LPKKKQDWESLKKKASLIGIDVDQILEELTTTVAEKAQAKVEVSLNEITSKYETKLNAIMAKLESIDAEKIAYQAAGLLKESLPKFSSEEIIKQVESHVAGKITETLQLINEKLSTNLDTRITEVFSELKVIKDTIPAVIEQRQEAFREEIAQYIRELGGNSKAPAGLAKGGPLSFLDSIPDETKSHLFEKLIDKLTGSQNDANLAALLLQAKLDGIFTGEKLAKGEATIRDAISGILPNVSK